MKTGKRLLIEYFSIAVDKIQAGEREGAVRALSRPIGNIRIQSNRFRAEAA